MYAVSSERLIDTVAQAGLRHCLRLIVACYHYTYACCCLYQDAVEALRSSYGKYAYLWKTPMEPYFNEFCADALVTSPLGQKLTDIKKYEEAIK